MNENKGNNFNVIFLDDNTLTFHGFTELGAQITINNVLNSVWISPPRESDFKGAMRIDIQGHMTKNAELIQLLQECKAIGYNFNFVDGTYFQTQIKINPEDID